MEGAPCTVVVAVAEAYTVRILEVLPHLAAAEATAGNLGFSRAVAEVLAAVVLRGGAMWWCGRNRLSTHKLGLKIRRFIMYTQNGLLF